MLNNILSRNVYSIGRILKRNCLPHDAIEGQMMEVKGVVRIKIYWELKEEAEDGKRWKRHFIN